MKLKLASKKCCFYIDISGFFLFDVWTQKEVKVFTLIAVHLVVMMWFWHPQSWRNSPCSRLDATAGSRQPLFKAFPLFGGFWVTFRVLNMGFLDPSIYVTNRSVWYHKIPRIRNRFIWTYIVAICIQCIYIIQFVFSSNAHRIHGTGLFTYMKIININ